MNKVFIRNLILFFALTINFSVHTKANDKKFFFCTEIGNGFQQDFVKRNNLLNMRIFYHGHFLKHGTLIIDKIQFEKIINNIIPNKFDNGYAVIDFEGEEYYYLFVNKKTTSKEYKIYVSRYISKYLDLINFAKKIRPNVKWSFYDVPTYFTENRSSYLNHYSFSELYKKIDFLAPSLYLEDNSKLNNVYEKLTKCLEIGEKYKKPTFPFVWNRFAGTSFMNSLISINDFETYIKYIVNYSLNGKKINGLVWWNCENYLYENRNSFSSIRNEYKNKSVNNATLHQQNLIQNYYNKIRNILIK